MSTDIDERFAGHVSERLHRIAAELSPGPGLEAAIVQREAERRQRRTAARFASGLAVVALVVVGLGWIGRRDDAPTQTVESSGFSAPEVIYPVVDETVLPDDLLGQLHPDIATSAPGQWSGALAPANDPSNPASFVLVSVVRTSGPVTTAGRTPRRPDVAEDTNERGSTLTQQRDGFTVTLFTHNLDVGYALIDRVQPDTGAVGFDVGANSDQPEFVWITRPFEAATTTAALYSADLAALDVVVEAMPLSYLLAFGGCEAATDGVTLCELPSGYRAALIELDPSHTLRVSSIRLTTEQLRPIALGVHFVTFDQWDAEGIPAPTTVPTSQPGMFWPLLDEPTVPHRLSPLQG